MTGDPRGLTEYSSRRYWQFRAEADLYVGRLTSSVFKPAFDTRGEPGNILQMKPRRRFRPVVFLV